MEGRREDSKCYSVYVGHLAPNVSKEELLDLFKGYTSVQECFMKPEEEDSEFKWAFIRFTRKEDADKAIEDLNGWPVRGLKIKLEYSRDKPHAQHRHRERIRRPRMVHDKLSDHDRIKMDALKDALLEWDQNRPDGTKDPMELLEYVAGLSPRLCPPYTDERFGYKPIDLDILNLNEES